MQSCSNVFSIDVSENDILKHGKSILSILLVDRTTRRNIIWGTSDYEDLGESYSAQFPITIDQITGKNQNVIQPRILKEKSDRTSRTKVRAEVFTPSWMCNEQNNLVDKAWFGRDDIFNTPGNESWITIESPIAFSDEAPRRWTDYIDEKRLEIACGEAPYLVSRYDTVTGAPINVSNRIGLLDRKIRVVNENTSNENDWMKWTIRAFQSVYGYEFQGDNLLLARENILYTFIDNLKDRFNREPTFEELKTIANIVSWNIWQMDGILFTVPFESVTEQYQQVTIADIMGDTKDEPCYCKIRDWRSKETITFKSLVR